MSRNLSCGNFRLSFDEPKVMAIINLTPDSFSGDGLHCARDAALRAAESAISEGAAILDLGGESSRPGAAPVSEDAELERVIPILEALRGCGVPISIDTVKPAVMRAAIGSGAALINDIQALTADGALDLVANSSVGACLMHMQGAPRTMQAEPQYYDVVAQVCDFLSERAGALESAGCTKDRILLDPGFGFGKTIEHNTQLFRALPRIASLGYPVLVGVSRKSMLGEITGRAVGQRLVASTAAAVMAADYGASILRVHDVAATLDALKVWAALRHN